MSGDVWFTSDTHFDHHNVAVGHRGFASSEEHDEVLIEKWNARVGPYDLVWHLGDVGRGSSGMEHRDYVLGCVGRLNGLIHLVAGNHDPVHSMHRDSHRHQMRWSMHFMSIQSLARRHVDGKDVMLSHFPYTGDHVPEDRHVQYRLRNEGLPLIHGHVHQLWKVKPGDGEPPQVNVGVDVWGFAPAHLDEIASLLK